MASKELLLVGLGNPGPRYALTRHNAGFIFLDYLAQGLGLRFTSKSSIEGEYALGELPFPKGATTKIHLLKPMTFMNLSGRSVANYMQNTSLTEENVIA